MMSKKIALALGIGLAACAPAWAVSTQVGTSGAQFLKLGAGARAAGMAEAYSAVADDPYALFYNPAGITRLRESQVAASHSALFQGANYEVAAFGYPFHGGRSAEGSRDVLGLSIYSLSIADFERRTGDTSKPAGYFGLGDYSYNATYAHRFDATLSGGVTGKIIHQTIDSYSSSAYAVDAGVQFTPRPQGARPVTFAAVMKNLGTRTQFAGSESDPLPFGFVLGAGAPIFKNLIADIDVSKYRDTDLYLSAGGEYRHTFDNEFVGAFRMGYTSARKDQDGLNGLALGAGVRFYRAGFDFAWVPFGDLGNTFRFSLQIRFAGTGGEAKAMESPVQAQVPGGASGESKAAEAPAQAQAPGATPGESRPSAAPAIVPGPGGQ